MKTNYVCTAQCWKMEVVTTLRRFQCVVTEMSYTECRCSSWPIVEFFCAKRVGATSSEDFLGYLCLQYSLQMFYSVSYLLTYT